MLKKYFHYIKNPTLEEDPNRSLSYRVGIFFTLFLTCFVVSFFISIFIGMLYTSGLIENDYHAFDDLQEKLTSLQLFLAASLVFGVINGNACVRFLEV